MVGLTGTFIAGGCAGFTGTNIGGSVGLVGLTGTDIGGCAGLTGTAIVGVGGTSGSTDIGGVFTIDGGVTLPPTTSGLTCGAGISTRTGSAFGPSGGACGSDFGGTGCTAPGVGLGGATNGGCNVGTAGGLAGITGLTGTFIGG